MRRIESTLTRTTLIALLAPALLWGCTRADTDQAAKDTEREPVRYDARTFHETTSISGTSFSADGTRILVTSDATGVFNVYSQPVAGGEPVALTDSTVDAHYAVSWFPADDRFLFSADKGGNELTHLYVQEEDGTVIDLTPGESVKAFFAGWSGDDQSFYVASNERDPRAFDIYAYAVAKSGDTYPRTLLFENPGDVQPGAISRDGRYMALSEPRSNTRSDLHVLELASGKRQRISADSDGERGILGFAPDTSALYYSTDEHGEFSQAWSYDLASDEHSMVLAPDWDVWNVSFSDSGRYRVAVINEDAAAQVSILETATGNEVEIPGLPPGDLSQVTFSEDETQMAFYVRGSTSPADLWTWRIGEERARRLTSSLNPQIDENDLVASEVIRYPSFDGLEIPAILWRAHSATAETPGPAIVFVHGGPGGQTRRTYNAMLQHLVNHGYTILGVNNRGSSGYGKTFYHLDDRKHGDVDLDDCVEARNWLAERDWIDGNRIAIMGGSYGGYMTAAALAFRPEVFDAGIDIFGVTNWIRTIENTPPWWGVGRDALLEEIGDPGTEDRARLERISPLFHAHNITKPLLVIQGANDPRVLKVESDELVAAARENGAPVEYVVFDDEGHGFAKKENRIEASEAYRQFLDRYLGGPSDETSDHELPSGS